MPHYKSATNEIYWYDTDAEFSQFAPIGLTLISDDEVLIIQTPTPVVLTYQELRSVEYPSIQVQLDMQYQDAINNTSTWKDLITSIKTNNPKV